jgi:hypothetical protein
MKGKRELFAYCGIYCVDCLGYTGVIADGSEDFKKILDKYQFHRTAKAVFPDELKEYDEFYKMLEFMTQLRCAGKCRKGEDTPTSCEVRRCCREKGFFACYECDELQTCEKLKHIHEDLHYESALKNLLEIREMGLDEWLEKGTHHMYWDLSEDG